MPLNVLPRVLNAGTIGLGVIMHKSHANRGAHNAGIALTLRLQQRKALPTCGEIHTVQKVIQSTASSNVLNKRYHR